MTTTAQKPKPFDPYCNRTASDIPEMMLGAEDEGITPDDFAREDGTYNPATGEFACTECYIKLGQPTTPAGWKASTPTAV